jgi:hypothetical protein
MRIDFGNRFGMLAFETNSTNQDFKMSYTKGSDGWYTINYEIQSQLFV